MKNREIAKIFYEIAKFLRMDNVAFKPQAYEKAALSLEELKEDVPEIYRKGGLNALQEIPGVGKGLAEAIEEYLKTGKIKTIEDYKKKLPLKIDELLGIEGLGPRKIKILYEKLGIKNLKELEKQVKKHKIAPLFGFGETTEKNILQGIEFLKTSSGRLSIGKILPVAREVIEKLKTLKEIKQVSLAGSLRRGRETIGDADILVASDNPQKIMDFFVKLDGVEKVWAKGHTKSSIRLKAGFDMDLRVVKEDSFGAALQYFTGSKEHNITVRKIAIEKGLKLSEYGLFRGDKMIAGKTEQEIYKALDLLWIPPELRENEGEIEAAQNKTLPNLVELKDIKGDLHCHSNWDGGKHSIEEMAEAAIKMGYEYMGISDHTKWLHIERGLNEEQLLKQAEKIKKINSVIARSEATKQSKDGASSDSWIASSSTTVVGIPRNDGGINFRILAGCEANIMPDGSLDIKDNVLEKLDFVIAGIHSQLKMPKKQMTDRLIKAMKNSNVDIISHPTTRLLGKREGAQLDFDKILQTAKQTGTILEINSAPDRLDLNNFYIRLAKSNGVKMIINTDSHQKDRLNLMEYGIMQARRGWAEKQDIINTLPLKELLEFFR